jgi:hypothetical protein
MEGTIRFTRVLAGKGFALLLFIQVALADDASMQRPPTVFAEDVPPEDVPVLTEFPNTFAARDAFAAMFLSTETEDFEGFPNQTPLPITITAFSGGQATLEGDPSAAIYAGNHPFGQYPVSPMQFLRVNPSGGGFSMSLSEVVAGFSFFATDLNDAGGSMLVTTSLDGMNMKTYVLPPAKADATTMFAGFLDLEGFNFVQFKLENADTPDNFGFDNLSVYSFEQVQQTMVPTLSSTILRPPTLQPVNGTNNGSIPPISISTSPSPINTDPASLRPPTVLMDPTPSSGPISSPTPASAWLLEYLANLAAITTRQSKGSRSKTIEISRSEKNSKGRTKARTASKASCGPANDQWRGGGKGKFSEWRRERQLKWRGKGVGPSHVVNAYAISQEDCPDDRPGETPKYVRRRGGEATNQTRSHTGVKGKGEEKVSKITEVHVTGRKHEKHHSTGRKKTKVKGLESAPEEVSEKESIVAEGNVIGRKHEKHQSTGSKKTKVKGLESGPEEVSEKESIVGEGHVIGRKHEKHHSTGRQKTKKAKETENGPEEVWENESIAEGYVTAMKHGKQTTGKKTKAKGPEKVTDEVGPAETYYYVGVKAGPKSKGSAPGHRDVHSSNVFIRDRGQQ